MKKKDDPKYVESERLNNIDSFGRLIEGCGAYNGLSGKDAGPVPDQYDQFAIDNWFTALDFLEWYGV